MKTRLIVLFMAVLVFVGLVGLASRERAVGAVSAHQFGIALIAICVALFTVVMLILCLGQLGGIHKNRS